MKHYEGKELEELWNYPHLIEKISDRIHVAVIFKGEEIIYLIMEDLKNV